MPQLTGHQVVKKMVGEALKDIAPGFVTSVAKAKKQKGGYVTLSFHPFRFEPGLFFRAANYASMEGVPLLIIPEDPGKNACHE